ncbi:thioesterase family protein [Phreatobacter sp.]|uniref:thioesterase family protein n=1 Tax=Phreatobacter sp. TaxID=1966341 RepID=UPI0022C28EF1|nr:thioesterase family protein [Phreatobacter sp.]MCZ8313435.1 thioesterase family protein [Phreatobacter sp.]
MSLFDLCPDTGLAITPPMAVRPEMIDYNGHVNVAFYVKLFDEGLDILFERIGLSRAYVETRQMSFFALEAHVRYLREISLADRVRMRLRILDLDPKRIHYWMELVHADEGWLSATMESISIHVDMASRRPAPFPDDIMARLTAWHAADAERPRPEGVGQVIGIRRKG